MAKTTEPPHAELEDANARLHASLKQCREIVRDYRSKIAADADALSATRPPPTPD